MMPGIYDHLLALILVAVLPLTAQLIWYPRLKRLLAAGVPGVRRAAYRSTMVSEWVLAAAVVLLWVRAERSFPELGLRLPGGGGFWVGVVVLAAAWLFFRAQERRVQQEEAVREQARRQLAPLSPLLPHSREELKTFYALAVTAGICEEVLYRGFLIWYLRDFVGLWGAVVLSSLFFGLAHLYQGVKGVGKAGGLGLVFAGLYVFSGSLGVPMLLHALIDIRGGQIAFTALAGDEGKATAISAPSPKN